MSTTKRQPPFNYNTGSTLNDKGAQADHSKPSDKEIEAIAGKFADKGIRHAKGDEEARDGEV